jgi:MerR-like DNA binding protein
MKSVKNLPDKDVAARYGVTVRTIGNWDRDEDLCFPRALVINKRKYRREDELDEFDRRASRGAGGPKAA